MNINLENVTYKFLSNEEFYREDLAKIFVENGSTVPPPIGARILIAEDENKKLVGFFVGQLQFHLEPIWVAPEYRNTNLFYRIAKKMVESYNELKGLHLFVFSSGNFDKVLAKLGFDKMDYNVFRKVVE